MHINWPVIFFIKIIVDLFGKHMTCTNTQTILFSSAFRLIRSRWWLVCQIMILFGRRCHTQWFRFFVCLWLDQIIMMICVPAVSTILQWFWLEADVIHAFSVFGCLCHDELDHDDDCCVNCFDNLTFDFDWKQMPYMNIQFVFRLTLSWHNPIMIWFESRCHIRIFAVSSASALIAPRWWLV